MKRTIVFLVLPWLFSFTPKSKDPKVAGLELATYLDGTSKGYGGDSSEMEMILIDAYGKQVTRQMIGKTIEGDETTKTLLEFTLPKDVRGTKLLTWSHDKKDDDQWIYLPALKRVKRITSSTRSGSFMGSEFTYEDLTNQTLNNFNYELLGEEKFNGEPVWKLQRVSKKKSGYTKEISYISKSKEVALKVDYYGRQKDLLKVATFEGFKQLAANGKKFWRAEKVIMVNKKTKKQSHFVWKKRKLGAKFKSKVFKKRSLKK